MASTHDNNDDNARPVLNNRASVQVYLQRQVAVTNRNGDTFNLASEDADAALETSAVHFTGGLPAFLRGDDFSKRVKGKGADDIQRVTALALFIADYFEGGNRPEDLQCEDINCFKQILNIAINHFCREDGVFTEVAACEMAAISVTRQRLIDIKKSL